MAYERLDTKYTNGQVWDGAAVTRIDDAIEALDGAVEALDNQVNITVDSQVANSSDYSISGFMRPAGTEGTSSSYCRTDYIDIENFIEITVHCKPLATSVSPVVWYDSEKNYISGETAIEVTEQDLTYVVPDNAAYAIFSTGTLSTCQATGIRKLTKFEDLQTNTIATTNSYINTGFVRPAGTFSTGTSGYSYTDYIDISGYINLTINFYTTTVSVSPVVWFDANKNYISGETADSGDGQMCLEYSVPSSAVYAVFSTRSTGTYNVAGTKIVSINNNSSDVKSTVNLTDTIATSSDYVNTGFVRPAGTIGTSSGYSYTNFVDISAYHTITVHCKPSTTSVSPAVWYDASQTYISGETASVTTESDFVYTIPSNAVYARFSSATLDTKSVIGEKEVDVADVVLELKDKIEVGKVYISPTGSDDNDGLTSSTPLATISAVKNILDAKGELVFMEGEYENLAYDLSSFAKVSTTGEAKLVYYKEKIASATLVDGYTRVYQAPITTTSHSGYLWQHNVNDEATAILAEERHPLQRNRTHRLRSTRIYLASKFDTTSTTVAEFCTTIESTTDKYMYYIDSANAIVYFSAPNADFATYPIIVPSGTTLTASTERKVDISGLDIMYASILTTGLSGTLNNVKVSYSTSSGCIRWDDTFDLVLMNCEVAASSNDGINGHTSGDITCFNCWGHDCADDGESDHETCHIIQHGGLYEYNGNGCTPASGASGEYFNCIVRNNSDYAWVTDTGGTGFSAQGESAYMYCMGCFTSGCKIGFRHTGTDSTATFINCISKDDTTAFGSGTQINCTTE